MLIDWFFWFIFMSLRFLYSSLAHSQTLFFFFQKTKLHQKHMDITLTIVYLLALHYLNADHELHNSLQCMLYCVYPCRVDA